MAAGADTRHSDLKRMLEQRRRAILHGIRQQVRDASHDTSLARGARCGDVGEAMLQDAVRVALISMKTDIVLRVERALERLDEGIYGACDDCGEDIVESRLRALPFATRCRPCEELREGVESRRQWRPRTRNWRVGELEDR